MGRFMMLCLCCAGLVFGCETASEGTDTNNGDDALVQDVAVIDSGADVAVTDHGTGTDTAVSAVDCSGFTATWGQITHFATIVSSNGKCSLNFTVSDGTQLLQVDDQMNIVAGGGQYGVAVVSFACEEFGTCYGASGTVTITEIDITADDITADVVTGRKLAGDVDITAEMGPSPIHGSFSFAVTFP